jgi:hypothetical protein
MSTRHVVQKHRRGATADRRLRQVPTTPAGAPTRASCLPISRAIGILATLACAGWNSAYAQLHSYDGFGNGPLPTLDGSTGGAGWLSPWLDLGSSVSTTVGGDGLSYPGLRALPGAAITEAGGSYDAAMFDRQPTPIAPGPLYISMLLRPDAGFGLYAGLQFGVYPHHVIVGVPMGLYSYGFQLGRYLQFDSGVPIVEGTTALVVLEITTSGAATVYKLYVNPNLDQGKPARADAEAAYAGFPSIPSRFLLMNDGGCTTDELRVATTWADAVPAPPAGCFLLSGPSPASTCPGGQAAFSVSPDGVAGPFSYRWYRGPTLLADGPTGTGSLIAGALTRSIVITNVGPADASFYYCIVEHPCGQRSSPPAELSVCTADFNCDSTLDFFDYLDFVAAFDADNPSADFNADGSIDFFDYLDFAAAFSAGCP